MTQNPVTRPVNNSALPENEQIKDKISKPIKHIRRKSNESDVSLI